MKKYLLGIGAAVLLSATQASAAAIVYTTSGGNGVSGKATFNFSATTFTITLENLTNPTSFTDQELSGLTFKLTPAGSPTLSSVSPVAVLDCSGDHSVPCAPYAGVVPTNHGWDVSTDLSGLSDLTTTPLGFHPYAIINANYTLPNTGNGNLANPQHNPFLVGPVVFTFAGTFTGVSDVTFFWGTGPDTTTGTCTENCGGGGGGGGGGNIPEPASMMLVGLGLVGVASRIRRS